MSDWSPVAKVYEPLKAGSIDGTDVEPHDRAVWRAMSARYIPNKGVVGDPHLTLFVARLNQQTTEEKLWEIFVKYGDIRRLRLVRDIVTGISKGYAFIEYKEERSVMRARREANKLVVDQHDIFVDFEQERTLKGWVPRRQGGGQGGKKESGQLRFGGRDRPFRKPINLPPMVAERGLPQKWQNDHRWERTGETEIRCRDRDQSPDRDRKELRRNKREYERGREMDVINSHKMRKECERDGSRAESRREKKKRQR